VPKQGTGDRGQGVKKYLIFLRKENRIKQILFSPSNIMSSFSPLEETVAVVAVSGPQTLEQITKLINECFHTQYRFDEMWGSYEIPPSNPITTEAVMDVITENTGIFSLVEEKDGTSTVVGIDPEIRRSIATGEYKNAYLIAQHNCSQR
jgi:hypothetical protein